MACVTRSAVVVAEDDRFDASFTASNEALLELVSAEVLPVRRWPEWGIEHAHFPSFRLFVGLYGLLREAVHVDGVWERGTKEIVCAFVSATNNCPFCCNVHYVCARLAGVDEAVSIIRESRPTHISDDRLRSLVTWAVAFRQPQSEQVTSPPPLSPRDAVELLACVLLVVYKNVVVKVFVGANAVPDASPLSARIAGKHPLSLAMLNWWIGRGLLSTPPGSLRPGGMQRVWATLPEPFDPTSGVELPDALWWARPSGPISDALRFLAAEHRRIATEWLPPAVVEAVTHWVNTSYTGQELPPRNKFDWAAAAVTPAVTAAGEDAVFLVTFCLTAALTAGRADEALLNDFRARFGLPGKPAELMLREVIAWASWTVALRVVGWMAEHTSPRSHGVPSDG